MRKFSSFEEENRANHDFWQRMTPAQRVVIVEQLREEWWEQHGEGEPRILQVVRVLEQPAGRLC